MVVVLAAQHPCFVSSTKNNSNRNFPVIKTHAEDVVYSIFPAKDHFTCWEDKVGSGGGPTQKLTRDIGAFSRRMLVNTPLTSWLKGLISPSNTVAGSLYDTNEDDKPQQYLTFILPDLKEHRWRYRGIEEYRNTGIDAELWEWDLTEGDMEMTYKFYMDLEGVPLELWMMGVNLYTGGHKDEYVATFYDWQVGPIPDEEFEPPQNVACIPSEPDTAKAKFRVLTPLLQFFPSVHWGHAAYDAFMHQHARRHSSVEQYHRRLKEFLASTAFVQEWNSYQGDKKRHRVALNRFADWNREEYLVYVKGRVVGKDHAARVASLKEHKVTVPPHMLPRDVIWKGTPADSPVKDQAACGSCWAFSAAGAFESALYRLHGAQQLLSEQNLIDCNWEGDLGNTGCFGGDQPRALQWILQTGGLATEESYPYRGVNDFCRNTSDKVPLTGEIVIVKGGEQALKEALFTKGPMAVSVDAASDAFRFYAGGVFSDERCSTAAADLDHAVLISGYGTTDNGEDYWLVKNIWSPYWGEEGYIYITRSPNDCGIATEPIYIELQQP